MHIADLGVEGRKGVCIYNCWRKRIPVGNGSYKKRILIRVYSGPWMDECKLMLLTGPGSAFGGNEFGGERDDDFPTIDFVEQCQFVHRAARLQR